MMLRVGVVRPDRLDPWPDRSGQAPGLSGRPDRPAGLRQPWPACTVDMAGKSVLDFFKLLISDEILSSIADQTNLYADQYICSNTVKPKSRASAWKQVPHDAAEVKKFVATIIVMGLVPYHAISK